MKYAYALKYMESFEPAANGIGFSPQRLSELCSKLGRINVGSGFIHVPGGGAGHGCALIIEAMIRRAGYRVGYVTAAYGLEIRSLVRVNGEIPSIDDFNKLAGVIKETVGRENKSQYSREEIAVAYALLVCKLEGCDFVVFEDSLDIQGLFSVCAPFDIAVVPEAYGELPEAYLSMLKQRTREVISGEQRQDAHAFLVKKCAADGLRLSFPMKSQLTVTASSCRRVEFSYKGKTGYRINSASYMLRDSALVAVEVAHAIRRAGIKLPGSAMVEGIKEIGDAGCLAMLSSSPTVITDISTCRGEMALLAENISELPESVRTGKKTLCFCAYDVNDVKNALEAFAGIDFDEVFCVGGRLDGIKEELPENCRVAVFSDADEAAERIARSDERDRLYLCFGNIPFAERIKAKILEFIGGI